MNKDQFAVTRDGVSQAERWFDTLVPSYVQIDSREIPDFVEFLFELSKKINYYNTDNKPAGNWEDFFTSDANLVIILLSRLDLTDMDSKFDAIRNEILNAVTDAQAIDSLRELILFIHELYHKLNTTLKQFEGTSDLPEAETIIYLIGRIESVGKTLYSYYKEATNLFPKVKVPSIEKELEGVESDTGIQDDFFKQGSNDREVIANSVIHLKKLFDELLSKLLRLNHATKEYVKERRFLEHQFMPQVGLFIAFLELYGYVRKRLNGLVQKHLDYYYQDLLGLKYEELQPDSVHLAIEPEDQAPRLMIGTEDLLLVEAEGTEQSVYFSPRRKQILSKAKIKSIKTIFLSNYKQIAAQASSYNDVKEVQIFKAEPPLFKPSEFIKNGGEYTSWAVMGEDQHDMPDSERTMLDADPGIVVVSPLFYQVEGARTFTIKMELKSNEFHNLNDYIENYSIARNNLSRETAEHKLFSQAFRLIYTTSDGWESIKSYSSKIYNSDKNISTLLLSFKLSGSNKAFDCYQEEIHKTSLPTKLPALKLLLNSDVEHYAYSFLHSIQLNRVTIHVKVKGFRSFKLQNNVGPLSPAAPFQPFGPQPSIGSFLDVKNSNVFNRYLKNFEVRINWLELPREREGFASYYSGYPSNFKNESFKVELSALSKGIYKPDNSIRQRFRLFSSDPVTEELFPETLISGVDFKKIQFQNEPELNDESLFNEPFFRNGAVRLEFCSPSEGFGNRLFQQVFPDTILNNAKKFKKKLPLPNQPYLPVVKTIEVDFEAEFSEGFKEGQIKDENFQLFHLFPFGYQKIFPSTEKKNYLLMPNFDNFSNLMIGLEDIEPNTELSIFFQLEEKSFHHTLHDPDPINWSYLESNNWVNFRPRDIMSNTTENFINSGIVQLRMPSEIFLDNTILPKGLFWIRASSSGRHGLYGRVKAIMLNGFLATRVIEENVNKQMVLLEAGKIKGFAKSIKGIQSVLQIFPSFGGARAETSENYYVRVSERLRYKNRPVQIRDLAQIILKEFPQILIVKPFSSRWENFEVIPGVDIHVVLIPRESEGGSFITEKPSVSLSELYKVKKFVSSVVSPFMKIEIGNALYERVKVFCKVLFHENLEADSSILRRKFIQDINKYIAPWLYGEDTNLKIGSRIYKAELLISLKNLSYVKYISGFSVVHFSTESDLGGEESYAQVIDSAVSQIDIIEGTTPASVLIPSPFHIVEILRDMDYNDPQKSGIGNFIIGEEFLVAQELTEKEQVIINEDTEEQFGLIISHNIE